MMKRMGTLGMFALFAAGGGLVSTQGLTPPQPVSPEPPPPLPVSMQTQPALAVPQPTSGRLAAPDYETTALPPDSIPPASLVPLKIPGYELRVLDRKKPVRFNVGGVWAESSLPIFIYMPTNDLGLATGLLRKARDQLGELSRKPEWTADELQGVLSNLDAASRAIDDGAPSPASVPRSRANGGLRAAGLPTTSAVPPSNPGAPATGAPPDAAPRSP